MPSRHHRRHRHRGHRHHRHGRRKKIQWEKWLPYLGVVGAVILWEAATMLAWSIYQDGAGGGGATQRAPLAEVGSPTTSPSNRLDPAPLDTFATDSELEGGYVDRVEPEDEADREADIRRQPNPYSILRLFGL